MIIGLKFIPRRTTQLNKPNNHGHRSSLAFKNVLAMNPRIARDNYFYGGFILFYFFTI